MKKILLLSRPLLPAIVAALISSPQPAGAQSIWNATNSVSANTNWSSSANWLPNGVPGASSNVLFIDPGAVGGTGIPNNVVDANTTIRQLAYRQTNGVHTTLILPGVTLTVSNSVAGTNVLLGMETTNAIYNTLVVNSAISGAGGTLAVIMTNTASVIAVRQINNLAGAHLAVLDMSGLDNFNATVGRVWVGALPQSGNATRPQGQLNLAKTNNITALAGGTKTLPAIDVGDTGSSPGVGSILALGISNNIAADTMVIGNQRSGATLNFSSAFQNLTPLASLYLRGNTNSRVSTFNIGDNSSATAAIGSSCNGVVDFTGGTVDAMVDSMSIGNGQPITGSGSTGTAMGTLTMSAGNLNVNTMEVGHQTTAGVVAANTGTVNINGGTFTVNTSLRLAFWGGSGGQSSGSIFIQAPGILQANNIVAGGGNTSAVNLFGGTLIVSNTMGTPASPLSALTVYSSPTLQFSVVSGVTACEVKSLSGDSSGVINISSLPPIPQYPFQFPLITYQSGSGSGLTFAMGTLPSTFKGSISNDNSSTIYLVVTNGPSLASVTWGGGVNNLWDTNTLNWTNASSATVAYADPDVVTFTDLAKTNNVNITATFSPNGWLQENNTKNFTFSGTGHITGSGNLTMNGTGTVTLSESGGDNFNGGILANAGTVVLDDANSAISGGLTIAGGATVQIGNNDANGALPSGSLDDEGTLVFKRTDNVLVSTIISGGGGALTQNGSGTLILGAASAYGGNTTVTAGTLALTNSGSIASSAEVDVTGATLDVSGASGITTLTSLNLANAGLTVSVGSPQTNLNMTSLSMGGAGNTLNISALPVTVIYPTTFTVLKSANPITGFNMGVGALPSGTPAYGGTLALSGDSTALLLTLTNGPVGIRPSVTWSGVDALNSVNTNWSDNQNWQAPGVPTNVDKVVFNNTAATANSALSTPGGGASSLIPANINNIVDRNFTIASLTYTNKGGTYHNTYITDGATLNVTNFFTVGAFDSASTLQQEFANIAGGKGATLNVNNPSNNIQVWMGNSGTQLSYAMLDMSGLDKFTANVNQLVVGATVGNIVNRPSGILYLARTNTITASFITTNDVETGSTTATTAIIIGDCNQNQGPTNYVYLGQVNSISADTIVFARQKQSANVLFDPIYTNNASVTFQGYSSSLVSNLDVGAGAGNTGTTAGTGDLNLNGGLVTATVDTMNIGRASSGATGTGTTTGSLEFDAGTITANTVNVGYEPAVGTKVGVGTVNVNTNTTIATGAHLVVNGNLNLGVNADNAVAGTSGTLNINGGTVQANTIVAGTNGAPSIINLNAGTLSVTGTAGTPAAPLTTLALTGGATLQLAVDGSANVTNLVATSVTTSGPITLKIGSLTSVVTNVTYPLISYTGTDPYSSLSLATLPAGYTGSLVDNSGIVGLKLTVVPAVVHPAHITSISVSGTTLNLSATNGVSGGRFVLLGTTNLTLPSTQWTPILTNNFNGSGNLNLSTNIINPAVPREFYRLSE